MSKFDAEVLSCVQLNSNIQNCPGKKNNNIDEVLRFQGLFLQWVFKFASKWCVTQTVREKYLFISASVNCGDTQEGRFQDEVPEMGGMPAVSLCAIRRDEVLRQAPVRILWLPLVSRPMVTRTCDKSGAGNF